MKTFAKSQLTKKFIPRKAVVYMFLPQAEPLCNSRCTGCYVLASESFKRRVRRSEEQIINDMRRLTALGYYVSASTTEILMNERYLEMITACKAEHVLTNGKILVRKPEITAALKEVGVMQIYLTANFENSGLLLPDQDSFREAVYIVLNSGLEPVVRITLTKNNLENMLGMIEACKKLGIKAIQFLRFMPIETGPETLDETGAKRAFELLELARKKNPDIFLSAGGTLGSQFRKKRFCCPVGKTQFTIGVDNVIYPCIYLTQNENALGTYENGELRVERTFDVPGNELDCPAYRYYTSRSNH